MANAVRRERSDAEKAQGATGKIVAMSMVAMVAFLVQGAWYDNPEVVKTVPLGIQASKTDPHYMSKSADGATLLVNLQAQGDAAPTRLVDFKGLVDEFQEGAVIRQVVSKPSEGYGVDWKGGAISSDLGVALIGSGKSASTCAFATEGEIWIKDVGLKPLTTSNGMFVDGLAFGTGSAYVYSNEYSGGDRGKIAQWTYDAAIGQLVFVKDFKTSLTRIRSVTVRNFGGKDFVFCGEGNDGANPKVVAIDVSGDTWTETVLSSGLAGLNEVTTLKLSNAEDENPILYVMSDDGHLAICKLAVSEGALSFVETVKTLEPATLKTLAGVPAGTTAKFRNFEVTEDGTRAVFLHAGTTAELAFSVIWNGEPYVQSDGTQCIPIPYYATRKTHYEIDYQFTESQKNATFVGGWEVSGTRAAIMANGSGNIEAQVSGKWSTGTGACGVKRHLSVLDCPSCTLTTTTEGVSTSKTYTEMEFNQASIPVSLFANATNNIGNLFAHPCKMKIYSFKIMEDGEILYDLRPATRDGKVGFADRRTGAFYTDPAHDLASGGDLRPVASAEAPYVSSPSGGVSVDTGYKVTKDTCIEVDFAMLDTANNPQPFVLAGGKENVANEIYSRVYINGAGGFSYSSTDKGNYTPLGAANGAQVPARANVRHRVTLDNYNKKLVFVTDGLTNLNCVMSGTRTNPGTKTLKLFANEDGAKNFAKMKLYGCRIWEKGELVRNYVPMKNGTVGILKDLVTGHRFASTTATALTCGEMTPEEPWAQSDGKSFVVLDYKPNAKTVLEVECSNLTRTSGKGIFGVDDGNNSLFCNVNTKPGPEVKTHGAYSWTMSTDDTQVGGRHTVVVDVPKSYVYFRVNGVNKWSTNMGEIRKNDDGSLYFGHSGYVTNVAEATYPIALFGINKTTPDPANGAVVRIYSATVTEDGKVIHNYLPCRRDGKVGFRDTITGKFFAESLNNGATSLATSEDLPVDNSVSAAPSDAYIESDATQCIQTGYYPKKTTKIEIDFQLTGMKNDYYLLGCNQTPNWELYVSADRTYRTISHSGWKTVDAGPAQQNRNTVIIDRPAKKVYLKGYGATRSYNLPTDPTDADSTLQLGLFATQYSDGTHFGKTPMRLYSFRIYESDQLVHEYLPYTKDGVVGLRDTKTGGILQNCATGANPFKFSGMGTDGSGSFFDEEPQDCTLAAGDGGNLSAYAPGAVAYRWLRDGKLIAGATESDLPVSWMKKPRTSVYSVIPVYSVCGRLVEGSPVTAEVTNEPLGMALIIR